MAITVMSLKEAQTIIDLYSQALIDSPALKKNDHIRFSYLKGYDLLDVDNALKLKVAYTVFNYSEITQEKLETLNRLVSQMGSALALASFTFAPDNLVQNLNKLNLDDPDLILKRIRILTNNEQNDFFTKLANTETQGSFLNYCLSIGKTDEMYWEKIFERIGILWDERTEDDPILTIVNYKEVFFEKKKILENSIGEMPGKTVNLTDNTTSLYQRNKNILDVLMWLTILGIGLLYPPIRIAMFCLFTIVGLIQTYYWVTEPIENRRRFALNLVYLLLYLTGIFFVELGFYILIILLILFLWNFLKKQLKPL